MKWRQGLPEINFKQIGKSVIVALIFATLLEYISILDAHALINSCRNESEQLYLDAGNANMENCSIKNDVYIATQDDPQLIFEDVNTYVGNIIIYYNDVSSSVLNGQIFVSDNTEEFTEENSYKYSFLENKKILIATINRHADSLRIDIGDLKGDACKIKKIIINPSFLTYVMYSWNNMSIIRILVYILVILVVLGAITNKVLFFECCFKYRWWIGIGLIIFCTLCKLHGSSIGMLPQMLGTEDTSRLWGTLRAIQYDEFVVFTGRTLGQIASGFEWFSNLLGYSAQDMYLIYGQPVKDIATIFRPFSVGYMFLGAEYGIAFYWSSRIIIGTLVSFEFGRLISKDNRKLSVAYAALLMWSPLVQWWSAINETVELLLFGQLAILLLYKYLTVKKMKIKIILMVGLVLSAGTFALALYPAREIPFFYVFLACCVAMLLENKKILKVNRHDIVIWGIGIFFLGACILHVFFRSQSTLPILMNTVSPGKRLYAGGPIENIVELFKGWNSYIWSFTTTANACEKSGVLNFYPIGFVLSILIVFKEKKLDKWIICLNIINIFLTIYLLFQMPSVVQKITLLGHATARIYDGIQVINLIVLIRTIVIIKENIKSYKKIIICTGIMATLFSFAGLTGLIDESMKMLIVVIDIIIIWMLGNVGEKNGCYRFTLAMIILSVIGGGMVQPISSGLNTIYDLQLVQQIEKINNSDKGMWVVDSSAIANLPTVVGAKTMNATETYPDIKLWNDLGLKNQENCWNRYLHTSVLIDDVTYVEMLNDIDQVLLHVPIEKLKDIGVKYIITTQDLSEYQSVQRLTGANTRNIYKIL